MNACVSVHKQFAEHYGSSQSGLRSFLAPGRINLIGEHIDYNGGLVMPAALSLGIAAVCRSRGDHIAHFSSSGGALDVEVDLSQPIVPVPERGWGNYPAGVLHELIAAGYELPGADVFYSSTLPQGAGLSSSAALEVLTAYMFATLAGASQLSLKAIAVLCQRTENQFIGVNCGIMDQFAVALGKADHALVLDCASLDYHYVPINFETCQLVIMNTGVQHDLTVSRYNERRAECEEASALLGQSVQSTGLAHARLSDAQAVILDPVILRRARHVITEQQRVERSVVLLAAGDTAGFGRLLTASHASLRDDYEVTGPHLDAIVEAANAFPGCLGARMTGAGFGGCAIALVQKSAVEEFTKWVDSSYGSAVGLEPHFYLAHVADGVHETTGEAEWKM
ncbi:MAG: galactokinase [Candidatus Cryosericum sp.]